MVYSYTNGAGRGVTDDPTSIIGAVVLVHHGRGRGRRGGRGGRGGRRGGGRRRRGRRGGIKGPSVSKLRHCVKAEGERLCVGKMPVQHVEFVLGHTVDEAEEGANGEEMARLERERKT